MEKVWLGFTKRLEMKVPNTFPSTTFNNIALIGEAPGTNETREGHPFVGQAGARLNNLLEAAGIDRSSCYIGNVCQHQPPGNDITKWDWHGPQIQAGISQLSEDLNKLEPNICVLLGNTPLKMFSGEKRPISKWRGSLFMSVNDFKCIATYHPASLLPNRQPQNKPWAVFDLQRALEESKSPHLVLPSRDIKIWEDPLEATSRLYELARYSIPMGFDIEGGTTGMTCFAFSPSPDKADVFPLIRQDGTHLHEPAKEQHILDALKHACRDTKLVLHNGLYDAFVLQYTYQIPINITHDTMVMWWELYSELEQGLDDISSVLTREPYYKLERKSQDDTKAWIYNGKDAAVTLECCQQMVPKLDPDQGKHYDFNIALLPAILHMELRGIPIDNKARLNLLEETKKEALALQHQLNEISGRGLPASMEDRLQLLKERLCRKNPRKTILELVPLKKKRKARVDKPAWWTTHRQVKRTQPVTITTPLDIITYAKPSQVELATEATAILNPQTKLSDVELALLSTKLDCHLNTSSPKFNDWLYKEKKFPPQYIKEGGRNTTRLAHNADALLSIYLSTRNEDIKQALRLVSCLTNIKTLQKGPDVDGRMRCSLNPVATKTGRFNSSTSPCGVGFNLQTVTKDQRIYFIADPLCDIAEIDLEGADAWTIAAWCKQLGDDRMWQDLQAGMKIACIIALCHEHGQEVNDWPLGKLQQMVKTVDQSSWLYKACKMVLYGSCYLMGERTMSSQILSQSYKKSGEPTYVAPKTCKEIQQQGVFVRYPGLQVWHRYMANHILTQPHLVSASGHKRVLFGNRKDPYGRVDRLMHGTALANEPQENTTYAIKLALLRLWQDPANRDSSNNLIVEPLLTVHDSLLLQWKQVDREFAIAKTKEWFNNTLTIAGQEMEIPFSGSYGENWKLEEGVEI